MCLAFKGIVVMSQYSVLQECLDRSLCQFALIGDLDMVIKLVHQGADILVNNQEPLRLASDGDHEHVMRFLVEWLVYKLD
jgi:hypothetical protein